MRDYETWRPMTSEQLDETGQNIQRMLDEERSEYALFERRIRRIKGYIAELRRWLAW